MADDFKYHIDHHGSLVRPSGLLAARTSDDLAALAVAETEAVAAVSHALRRLTLSAVGDGQFRREHFESVVYDRVEGFAPVGGTQPLADAAGIPADRSRVLRDSPRAAGRLAQAEVAPVLATVDRPVFVQLPSPGYLAAVGSALGSSADLDAARARGAALAAVLRAEIEALAADGVAYVALGNPCTRRCSRRRGGSGWRPSAWMLMRCLACCSRRIVRRWPGSRFRIPSAWGST